MGGAMINKALIQFSVVGWSCSPSLLFTCDQTMVEVMKIMVTSSKGPMYRLLRSVLPTLQQATADPRLCWRLLDIHRQVWVSLSIQQWELLVLDLILSGLRIPVTNRKGFLKPSHMVALCFLICFRP